MVPIMTKRWVLTTAAASTALVATWGILAGTPAEGKAADVLSKKILSVKTSTDTGFVGTGQASVQVTTVKYDDGSGYAEASMPSEGIVVPPTGAAARRAASARITQADIDHYLAAGAPPAGVVDRGPQPGEGESKAVKRGRTVVAAAAASNPYIDPQCTGWISASGNDVHYNLCINYTYKKTLGNGNWLFASAGTESAYTDDTNCLDCDNLVGLSGYQDNSVATVVDWAPIATQSQGSCTDVGLSVAYSGVGASLSKSVCPDTFGPFQLANTSSGSKWSTKNEVAQNTYRGTHFVNLISMPHANLVAPHAQVWWD